MNKNNLKLIKGVVEERAVEEKAAEEGGIRKTFMKEQGGRNFYERTERKGENFGRIYSVRFVL